MTRRSCAPRVLVAGLTGFLACAACGGGSPAGPTAPGAPLPLSPVGDAVVDSTTPTLVVENARGYDAGQASYDFIVLPATGDRPIEEVAGVPAGSGRTQATVSRPLVRGAAYRWKVLARAAGGTVESPLATFQIGVACAPGTDPYAKAVADFFVTQCTRRTNRAIFLEPRNVLGAPDARAHSDTEEFYAGMMSLGQDGYVTVDMGVCAEDRPGADLRVFQFFESEPVTVRVSGSPDGPWASLGTRACGDGGIPVISNHCDFDLADGGLRVARYVRVEDAENFPCELAGTRSEGADIDAVEVLNIRR